MVWIEGKLNKAKFLPVMIFQISVVPLAAYSTLKNQSNVEKMKKSLMELAFRISSFGYYPFRHYLVPTYHLKKNQLVFFSIVLMWGKSNCDIFYKKTPLLFSIILTYYGFDLLILNIIKYYWNFIIWPLINFYYWIKVYYCLPCLWKTLKKFHNFTNP